jgi:serine/threonine protein kinase/tetratricopeptide (TPR) repeat protein
VQKIDDFEIRGELGRGAMGVVYRAYDPSRGCEVAIKLMTAAGTAVPDSVARFERECQASLRLDHPNVVKVIRAGSVGSVPYLALELVEGQDLDKRLSEGPLPQREAAELCSQVAAGLAHAHSRKVLHRDLKPANVLLHPVRGALLTDFGLAKVFGTLAGRSLTQSNDLLGSPAYMSPEQATADHERVGERSDVYGLGAILYECLTGRPPCWGSTLVQVLHEIVEVVPKRPSARVPGVDGRLDAICLKCLAKDPADRYASAAEVGQALEAFLEGRGGGAGKLVALGLGALGLTGGLALAISVASPGGTPSGVAPASPTLRQEASPTPSAAPVPSQPPELSPRPSLEPGPSQTPQPTRHNPFARPSRSPSPARPSPRDSAPPSLLPADDGELTGLSLSSWELEQLLAKAAEIAEAAPDSAPAQVDLARACLGTNDLPRGRAAIKRALALDADYGPAHRVRGMLLMRGRRKRSQGPRPLGDIIQTTAERSFTRALELDPDDWQAHRERAIVRTNLEQFSKAEQDYAVWIAKRPSPKAYNSRGFFEARRRRIPAAVADFERALKLDPTNAVALRNLAETSRALGKLAAASGYVARLLLQEPKDIKLLRLQVDLFSQRKKYPETIETALLLERVNPKGTLGPLRRAFAHQHLGQYRESRAPLERLLKLNPRHPQGLLLLLRARAEEREWAQVVESCDQILGLETLPSEPTLSQVKNTRKLALKQLAKQKR